VQVAGIYIHIMGRYNGQKVWKKNLFLPSRYRNILTRRTRTILFSYLIIYPSPFSKTINFDTTPPGSPAANCVTYTSSRALSSYYGTRTYAKPLTTSDTHTHIHILSRGYIFEKDDQMCVCVCVCVSVCMP
jgi:hypothetical protein